MVLCSPISAPPPTLLLWPGLKPVDPSWQAGGDGDAPVSSLVLCVRLAQFCMILYAKKPACSDVMCAVCPKPDCFQ